MDILDPEPLRENVIDYEFTFVGGTMTQFMLRPERTDNSFVQTVDQYVITVGKDQITVEKRNVLWMRRIERVLVTPVKKQIKPTPTTK